VKEGGVFARDRGGPNSGSLASYSRESLKKTGRGGIVIRANIPSSFGQLQDSKIKYDGRKLKRGGEGKRHKRNWKRRSGQLKKTRGGGETAKKGETENIVSWTGASEGRTRTANYEEALNLGELGNAEARGENPQSRTD